MIFNINKAVVSTMMMLAAAVSVDKVAVSNVVVVVFLSFCFTHVLSVLSYIITQKAISASQTKAISIVPSNNVIMMKPTITSGFVLVLVALLSSSSETVVQAKRFRGSETLQALSLAEEARGLDGASSSSAAALSPPPAERRPRR